MKKFILITQHENFDKFIQRKRFKKVQEFTYIQLNTDTKWKFITTYDDTIYLMRLPEMEFEDVIYCFNRFTWYDNIAGASILIAQKYGTQFLGYLKSKKVSKRFVKNLKVFSQIAFSYHNFFIEDNMQYTSLEKFYIKKVWDEIQVLVNNFIALYSDS